MNANAAKAICMNDQLDRHEKIAAGANNLREINKPDE